MNIKAIYPQSITIKYKPGYNPFKLNPSHF